MSDIRLRTWLGYAAALILYGGVGLGLLIFVVGLAVSLAPEGLNLERWGLSSAAGLVVAIQAFLFGGALRLLVRMDERLERLERKNA